MRVRHLIINISDFKLSGMMRIARQTCTGKIDGYERNQINFYKIINDKALLFIFTQELNPSSSTNITEPRMFVILKYYEQTLLALCKLSNKYLIYLIFKQIFFLNRPNCSKFRSVILETMTDACVETAGLILRSFRTIV